MPKLRFGKLIGPKAVILTAVLLAFMVGTSWAAHRPAPLMDYAPQETGIYDTYYDKLNETDCRGCHGSSLADRHHYTPHALQQDCTFCHPVGPAPDYNVAKYRDCRYGGADVMCHLDFTNGWHHNNPLADSDQCTACHNPAILGAWSNEQTMYPPSVVSPTPFDCENCHWEQLVDTIGTIKHPSTDIGYDPWGEKVANFRTTSTWPVGHPGAGTPNFGSQAGEMALHGSPPNQDNGYWYSATVLGDPRPVGMEKDILDNLGTHHMNMQGAVSAKCYDCHGNDPGSPSWDPNDPLLIRYCERCHSKASLHRIAGHVDGSEIWNYALYGNNAKAWEAAEMYGYTDAKVYRAFSTNERCWGCHGTKVQGLEPPYVGDPPVVDHLSSDKGEPGNVIVIYGSNFGNDYSDGCSVEIFSAGSWVKVPVVSWTMTEVAFRIPAWVFPVGAYQVRVSCPVCDTYDAYGVCTHTTITSSAGLALIITKHPTLDTIDTNADPSVPDDWSYGPYYCRVTLGGTGGFGATPSIPAGPGAITNVSSQVVMTSSASDGGGMTGDPDCPQCGSLVVSYVTENNVVWSDTQILFNLKWLWKDVNGNYVQDAAEVAAVDPRQFDPFDYAVRVRTIYWVDKAPFNGVCDQPSPQDPEDPANEITGVCISDPVNLSVIVEPWVFKAHPARVTKNARVTLVGAYLGTPGTPNSKIQIYAPDKTTLKATLLPTDARIKGWTATSIKFATKGSDIGKGVRWIRVIVGGVSSNRGALVKIRII